MVQPLLVLPLFKKYIFHFVLYYYPNQFTFKIYSMNSFQKFSLYRVHDLYWLTLIKKFFLYYSAVVYPIYPEYFFHVCNALLQF